MGHFQNEYDTNGKPICPACHASVLEHEPAARASSHISHLRCTWSGRDGQLVVRDSTIEERDRELSAFFASLKGVLARIQAIRAALSNAA